MNAAGKGRGDAGVQFLVDEGDDIRRGRQSTPLMREPAVCMRIAPQESSRIVRDISASQRNPLTSLTISAPARTARRATAAL